MEDKRVYDTFSYETQDQIAIFTFKGKALFNAAGLCDMEHIGKTFKECSDDNKLKVIVIKRSSETKDSREYSEFIKYASQAKEKHQIHRMLNFYSQFIMEVFSQNKFVISVDSGNIVAQFLNLSMACDYRIVADNTVIQKEYFRNGVIPKGGATFFLSQIVGKKKAYEILLSGDDITAKEALDMGLVDEVVPISELDDAALKRAEHFAAVPRYTLTGIKRLMNYPNVEDLKKYLEYENNVIVRMFEKLNID